MRKFLIFLCSLIFIAGCKDRQVVELKNSSSENIYFLISGSRTPTKNEIWGIRPISSKPRLKAEYDNKEQAKSIKHSLYRNLIEKDSLETILFSEGAEFFFNAITIRSIIKNRYNGEVHVFIITENDLLKHSDKEIVDKTMYKHFKTLRDEDIKENTLILEYF